MNVTTSVRFGPFRMDRAQKLLFRDGEVVALTPKAFEMLDLFVRNAGTVVDKESLMKGVWPDTFVDEANLSHHVFMLRRALGDDREGNRFIETIPRRGYRFVAPIDNVAPAETAPLPRRWNWMPLAVSALSLAAAVIFAGLWLRAAHPSNGAVKPLRFAISPSAGTAFTQTPVSMELAVSPQGDQLALTALDGSRSKLYIRRLDSVAAVPIAGTEDGTAPFWSPDGKWLGFFAGGFMKKVPVAGGPVLTICAARGGMASWSERGQIIFFEWGAGTSNFIRSVPAGGGVVRDLATPKKGAGWFPSFLPDGRHFIYFALREPAESGLYVASVDGGEDHRVSDVRSRGEIHGDDLYYVRESVLVRQKVDLQRFATVGDPVPIADSVFCFTPTGAANFSISSDGAVIAWQRRALPTQLVWRDGSGHELSRVGKPELYRSFAISPDGGRLALDLADATTQESGIWIDDLTRGVTTRITPPAQFAAAPMWTPTGDALLMSMANREESPTGAPGLAIFRLADGVTRWIRFSDSMQYPTGLTSDQKEIVCTIFTGRFSVIEAVSNESRPKVRPLETSTSYDSRDAVLSPDDRLLAFQSSESGRPEIYVRPFRGAGEKIRVSSNGGTEPQWTSDGRAVLFLSGAVLTRADLAPAPHLQVLKETPLFSVDSAGMMELALGRSHYAVRGDRILAREIPGGSDAEPVTVLVSRPPPRSD